MNPHTQPTPDLDEKPSVKNGGARKTHSIKWASARLLRLRFKLKDFAKGSDAPWMDMSPESEKRCRARVHQLQDQIIRLGGEL